MNTKDIQDLISFLVRSVSQNRDVKALTDGITQISSRISELQRRVLLADERNERLEKEIQQLRERIEKLQEVNRDLVQENKQVKSNDQLLLRLKNLEDKLEADHNSRLLGELARQVEKALCLRILNDPRVYSLTIMFKQLKNNADAKAAWNKLMPQLKWDNYLWQTLLYLKDTRSRPNHPTTTLHGEPVSAVFLRDLVNRNIENKYTKSDALKLIDILVEEHGTDNLFIYRY